MHAFNFFGKGEGDKKGIELGIVHETPPHDEMKEGVSFLNVTEDEVREVFGISKEELRELALSMISFANSEIARHTPSRQILSMLQQKYPSYDVNAVMKKYGYTPFEEANYDGVSKSTIH